jgi:hypothetical protein
MKSEFFLGRFRKQHTNETLKELDTHVIDTKLMNRHTQIEHSFGNI